MKDVHAIKIRPQNAIGALISALLLFVAPAYTSAVMLVTDQVYNKYSIAADYDKSYSFSNIKAMKQGNSILVSGWVTSAGKQLRGHIDIVVVDSSRKLEKRVSVNPYFNNQLRIGTKYKIGFPFKATIPLEHGVTAHRDIIRLALHRDSERRNTMYDCGANKAGQKHGNARYEIQISGR